MKFVLNDLKPGDRMIARIEEILSADEVIISMHGDLLRVANETRQPLRIGDKVALIVAAVGPLRFRLESRRADQRRNGHLDLNA